MVWYAERGATRAWQVIADLAMAVWGALWWDVATAAHALMATLGSPGRGLARVGERLADAMRDGAGAVDGAPLIGDLLAAPLRAAAGAGDGVTEVGQAQEAAALALATTTGRVVFLLPVLTVGLLWLVLRVRAARRTGALRRLRDGGHHDLLALRALTTMTPQTLLGASSDPVGDWRAGNVAALASLELRAGGLRDATPDPAPTAAVPS